MLVLATLPLTGIQIWFDWLAQLRRASDPHWAYGGFAMTRFVPTLVGVAVALACLVSVWFVPRRDGGPWVGLLSTVGAVSLHTFGLLFTIPAMLAIRLEIALVAACLIATSSDSGDVGRRDLGHRRLRRIEVRTDAPPQRVARVAPRHRRFVPVGLTHPRCYPAPAVRIPLLLYGLAVLVRAGFMLMFPDPAYPDSFYYVDVARALASGHGLNVDFVWIFAEVGGKLPVDAVLPIPSNAHWLPLASFIQAPFIALMGATAIASALPMVLIGSLAAPLTWFIARDIGASRTVGLGAGVMAAIPAAGAVFMAQPENFAIFQPLVAATLWFAARGLRGDTRAYAAAGPARRARLDRPERRLPARRGGRAGVRHRPGPRLAAPDARPTCRSRAAVGCLALYLLIVVPWWYRQLSVFGSISPTASTGTALWLVDYRQWNSITADVSLSNFLAQGPAGIIGSRVGGLVSAVANFALIVGSLVLVPFIVWGGWLRRRSDDLLPWFLFTAILFAGAMIVFPLHVPGGAFIHTAVGLGPYAYILALEGVAALVVAIARRRPAWDPARAIPLFSWVIVGLRGRHGLPLRAGRPGGLEGGRRAPPALAAELDRLGVPATDRLMSIDAGGFKYFTGRGGVVSPDDPIDTIRDVARRLRHPLADPRARCDGRGAAPRPRARRAAGLDRRTGLRRPRHRPSGGPALALYPVCFDPADTRCVPTP